MDTRILEIEFPQEVVVLILNYLIMNDLSTILSFRLISKYICFAIDNDSSLLSRELFGSVPEKSNKIFRSSPSCVFFKFAKHEEKRLSFNICHINYYIKYNVGWTIGTHELSQISPNPNINYSNISKLKTNLLSLISSTKQLELNGIVIDDIGFLPYDVNIYIRQNINARFYEKIQELYIAVKDNVRINTDRIIDEIYSLALWSYNIIEFVQLRDVVPIDINKQIGNNIHSNEPSRHIIKSPLIQSAAAKGNLSVVKYLVCEGADIHQRSENGEGETLWELVKRLTETSSAWLATTDRFKNLIAIKNYLISINNDSTDEPPKKKPRLG
jgi:hypothetical protein